VEKNRKQAAVAVAAAAGSFLIYSHNFYAPFQWACGGGGGGVLGSQGIG